MIVKPKQVVEIIYCCTCFRLFAAGYFSTNWAGVQSSNDGLLMVYGLDYLANSKYVFGRDVVFTYGPLGYLLYPQHIGSNLIIATWFRLCIHILWAVVLFAYAQAVRQKSQFLLFCFTYVMAVALGLSYEYQLLCMVLLLCYLPIKLEHPKSLGGVVLGLLTACLMLCKFNLGCGALVSVGLATLVFEEGIW